MGSRRPFKILYKIYRGHDVCYFIHFIATCRDAFVYILQPEVVRILKDTLFWSIHPYYCQYLHISILNSIVSHNCSQISNYKRVCEAEFFIAKTFGCDCYTFCITFVRMSNVKKYFHFKYWFLIWSLRVFPSSSKGHDVECWNFGKSMKYFRALMIFGYFHNSMLSHGWSFVRRLGRF